MNTFKSNNSNYFKKMSYHKSLSHDLNSVGTESASLWNFKNTYSSTIMIQI